MSDFLNVRFNKINCNEWDQQNQSFKEKKKNKVLLHNWIKRRLNRCSCENELRINLTNDKLYELNETGSEVYSYVTKCSYVMEFSILRMRLKRRKCNDMIFKFKLF